MLTSIPESTESLNNTSIIYDSKNLFNLFEIQSNAILTNSSGPADRGMVVFRVLDK